MVIFFSRRHLHAAAVGAALCLLSALPAGAKPKVEENANYEHLKINGRNFTLTANMAERENNRGLVTMPEPGGYATNQERKKWIRVLDPVYAQITAVGNHLYVKKENSFEAPYIEIVLKAKGNRFGIEKEVPLPYNNIQSAGNVIIGRKFLGRQWVGAEQSESGYSHEAIMYDSSILNADGSVANTMHRVDGDIRAWSPTILVVPFRDAASNRVFGLTDLQGNLIAPLIPGLTFVKAMSSGGRTQDLMAAPLDKDKKYWMPLRNDGTVPVEPLPIKGYLAQYEKLRDGTIIDFWFKEYESANGPAIGWVSPDLSEETGPRWKSIRMVRRGFPLKATYAGALLDHWLWVGQLLDGTWMGYESVGADLPTGYGARVLKPLAEKPLPTEEEMYKAVTPIFTERGDRTMAQAAEANAKYTAWKEQMKKDRGCDLGEDLYSGACVERTKWINEYNDALGTRSWDRAHTAAARLGGDRFAKWMLYASEAGIYSIAPETFYNLASGTTDAALAAKLRQRHADILAQRKRAAEEAKLAAAQAAAAPAPSSNNYSSSWSSSSWATSNSYKPAGPSHQQTLDNYLRDYKLWINGSSSYKPSSPY